MVEVLGVVGSTARGVVIALAGVFVVVAAVREDPKKARGLDGALHELLQMTGGPVLLGLVAAGLVAFGLFGFTEARWRRTGARSS
jgi:type IV secretory pathway VirB2 component (pilin)